MDTNIMALIICGIGLVFGAMGWLISRLFAIFDKAKDAAFTNKEKIAILEIENNNKIESLASLTEVKFEQLDEKLEVLFEMIKDLKEQIKSINNV